MRPRISSSWASACLLGDLLLGDQAAELALGDLAGLVQAQVHELLIDVLEDDGNAGGGDHLGDLPAHGSRAHDGRLEDEHLTSVRKGGARQASGLRPEKLPADGARSDGVRGDRRRRPGSARRASPSASRPSGAAGVVRGRPRRRGRPQAAAAGIGERALGVACDVADPAAMDALIAAAEGAFGPIDLFCANAGVATGARPRRAGAEWELALERQRRALTCSPAERLLPGWLERGSGYFLATASAAGAAVADRLGPLRGHQARGGRLRASGCRSPTTTAACRTSCLCPMGVRTPLLDEPLDGDELAAAVVATAGAVIEPGGRGRGGRAGARRRALPDPPPPRGADLHAAQGLGLRPLAGRHAAPAGRTCRGG